MEDFKASQCRFNRAQRKQILANRRNNGSVRLQHHAGQTTRASLHGARNNNGGGAATSGVNPAETNVNAAVGTAGATGGAGTSRGRRQRHAPSRTSTTPRSNALLWFVTVNFSSTEPTVLNVKEHDPHLEENVKKFAKEEGSRAFLVFERGAEKHKLHAHMVIQLKASACIAWLRFKIKQCCTAEHMNCNVQRVQGGPLGSFAGMLGYCIKGTYEYYLEDASHHTRGKRVTLQ
eukprot:scaffold76296_cov40-Prasinocladus_malaysianus.AAC.1